ncbi:CdaR family protein [Desulfosporosinus burensis]
MLDMFRRNLGVKILSLLFAILFWLFVLNDETPDKLLPEQTSAIPLVASGLDQNMVVMTQFPVVRVRIQGSNPSANIKDIYAQIDLSNAVPGESTYVIKVNTPPGMNVVDLQPASLKLTLDRVQEKTVPVEAIVSGNPANDYEVGSPIVKPSAVNVRGPSSILGTLDRVTVEISVSGASETVQIAKPVSFRDKGGKPIFGPNPAADILSAYPSSVDVIAPVIAKGLSTKMIPLRATTTGTPASGKELRSLVSTPASVTVQGTPQVLKAFDFLNIGPVDISNLSEDKNFQIPLDKVTLPQGISFLNGTNLSVFVQVGDGPIQKSISGVVVQVRNVGTDLKVDKITSPIDVVIEGHSNVLDKVTPEQIQLWVDASDKKAGDYLGSNVFWQLPPGVTLPTTVQVDYSLKAQVVKGVE